MLVIYSNSCKCKSFIDYVAPYVTVLSNLNYKAIETIAGLDSLLIGYPVLIDNDDVVYGRKAIIRKLGLSLTKYRLKQLVEYVKALF